MREPSDRKGHDTPPPEVTKRGAKKPYRTPRLVTYGNLAQLALAKGGTKNDAGLASKA